MTRAQGAPYLELSAPRRARVILDFEEAGDPIHTAEEGWAKIEGPWLHFYPDADRQWQSWPMSKVLCVAWEKIDGPPF